jgi:hypothetical protein
MTVEIVREDGVLKTVGLAGRRQAELRLKLIGEESERHGEELLRYVADYFTRAGKPIRSSKTMLYGYWLIKFVTDKSGFLNIWEYAATATQFTEGAELALKYWREQHAVCARAGGQFTAPSPDQLVVVSQGVFEGDAVKAVRYPSPEHMSGWWMVTDRYNGDANSMRQEHMYHLTSRRPDLAPYIALPFGYRFDLTQHEDIWLDKEVLEE